MKDALKRLVGKLYSYLGGDLCELTRKANHLLTQELKVDPASERETFLRAMVTLHDSKELTWLLQDIITSQKDLSFEEARSLTELNWGRATANGMMLLKDRLASYKNEFDETHKREEAFDPHKAI